MEPEQDFAERFLNYSEKMCDKVVNYYYSENIYCKIINYELFFTFTLTICLKKIAKNLFTISVCNY